MFVFQCLLTLINWTGCFYSTAIGGLMCYENPKNKITAVPANDEEIWGATFKVTKLNEYIYNIVSFSLY